MTRDEVFQKTLVEQEHQQLVQQQQQHNQDMEDKRRMEAK
jgi:hypothetical protein